MTETKKYGRAAMPDSIKMDFSVQGKPHTFDIKRQRFEKVVDRIDKDIHRGKDLDHIVRKHGDHFASPPVAQKQAFRSAASAVKQVAKAHNTPAHSGGDKKTIISQLMIAHPQATDGQIAKLAVAGGHMSSANARYLAKKARG